jgi:hypothetical protein
MSQCGFDFLLIHRLIDVILVRSIKLRQVLGNLLVQYFLIALEVLEAHMAAFRGYGLEFAAVDGDQLAGDQSHFTTTPEKDCSDRVLCL